MGVVARQGIKYSIISYISFLLGTFSTIFIYPVNTEFYGKLRFIQPSAELIYPFVVFGLSYANVKFYQKFKTNNQQLDFLWFSLKILIFNFSIIALGYVLFFNLFPHVVNPDLWEMGKFIFPVILALSIIQLFSKYITNYKRIAVTGIFENFFPKLGALTAFIACVHLEISADVSLYIFTSFFIFAMLGIVFYFYKLNKDKRSRKLTLLKDKELRLEIFYFCLFSVLGSLGSQLALNIDNIMISGLIDYKQNGIYSILMSIVAFLKIPMAGVLAISGPVIVEKLENNKLEELKEIYQKISRFLFLFGTILFACIVSGMDYLFLLMKNQELLHAKSIVYILGAATLFDLSTGFNSQLISFSKYYRFNIYAMLFLALLTIISNWIFIVKLNLGIEGVALATAISLILFNIVKMVFNYIKFKIQPFTKIYIYILLVGIAAVIAAYFLPEFSNNWLNLIFKPLTVLILFFISNYWFNFIPIKEILSTNLKLFLTGKKR